jgi:hypothetical protein
MSNNVRNKEIKVQRAAQSLDHFKNTVASSDDVNAGILKPVLIGAGVLVLLLVAWAGWSGMATKAVERHESALAEILRYVEGDGTVPVPAAEAEKRMREKLPALEYLAKTAPGSEQLVTDGVLASWRLMLGTAGSGAAGAVADPKDPWQRLRLAQRSLALGNGDETSRFLAPLHKGASPEEPWGKLYWKTRLECDRLQGKRDQAFKDLAEFKERFKNTPDANSLDPVVKGI